MELSRAPRKAKARLKIQSQVVAVIQSAAVAEGSGGGGGLRIVNFAVEQAIVVLAVLDLHPWGMVLVAQAEIQRQGIRGPPIVLKISAEDVGALPPAAGGDSQADRVGHAEEKVRLCRARPRPGYRQRIGSSGEFPGVVDAARTAIVAGVERVDPIAPILEAGMKKVSTVGNDDLILELNHGVGEVLLGADIGAADAADEAAAEIQGHQSGAARVAVLDPEILRHVAQAVVEAAVVDVCVVRAEANFVDEIGARRVRPVDHVVINRRMEQSVEEQREAIEAGIVFAAMRNAPEHPIVGA